MKRFNLLFFAICVLIFFQEDGFSQTMITNVTLVTNNFGAATNSEGIFLGTKIELTSISSANGTYSNTGVADISFVRRNLAVTNQSSMWYRRTATNSNVFVGNYKTNYAQVLLDNDFTSGTDNTFSNPNPGYRDNIGNIERLDFFFTNGVTASTNMNFAVFDRGTVNQHDPFAIAAVTAIDTVTMLPTAYAPLTYAPANWGSTNVLGTVEYRLFRYNTGDVITNSFSNTETGSQGVAGLSFSINELGLTNGQRIYGYSLFASDVTTGGNMTNLFNWNNPTYYPTNSSSATGGAGGIDLISVNGVIFFNILAIPEPSTAMYLVIPILFFIGRFYFRRRPAKTVFAKRE